MIGKPYLLMKESSMELNVFDEESDATIKVTQKMIKISDYDSETYHDHLQNNLAFNEFVTSGIANFKIEVPVNATTIKLVAKFRHDNLPITETSTTGYKIHSSLDHFIHVSSSTRKIQIGHYVIFHVKTNFPFKSFNWVIMSKDIILLTGSEFGDNLHQEVKTFSVVASPDMAPGFHILVYVKLNNEQVISDSAYYPVEPFQNQNIHISSNQIKDYKMNSVELKCEGHPGSIFLIDTKRQMNKLTQGIFDLTKSFILEKLHNFGSNGEMNKVATIDFDENESHSVAFIPTQSNSVDTKSLFDERNLIFVSNHLSLSESQCKEPGLYSCHSHGCYTIGQKCNGVLDCQHGEDEEGCHDTSKEILEEIKVNFYNFLPN